MFECSVVEELAQSSVKQRERKSGASTCKTPGQWRPKGGYMLKMLVAA